MKKTSAGSLKFRQALAILVLTLSACSHTNRRLEPAQSALVREKFQQAVQAKLEQEKKVFSSLNISRIERAAGDQIKVEYQVSYADTAIAGGKKKKNTPEVLYQYAGIATLTPSKSDINVWEVVQTQEESSLTEFAEPTLIFGRAPSAK